jgi:hypothetical protein
MRRWLRSIATLLGRTASPSASPAERPTPRAPRPDAPRSCEVCARRGRVYAEIGTSLWRMRQKIGDPGAQAAPDGLRGVQRHLQASQDILRDEGVEVVDHTGARFEPGMALKVIAFQPEPDLSHEQILETIRPSVYLGGEQIQMGEVIVGTPERGVRGGDPREA